MQRALNILGWVGTAIVFAAVAVQKNVRDVEPLPEELNT